MCVRIPDQERQNGKSDPCIGVVGKERKREEEREEPYVSETGDEGSFFGDAANLLRGVSYSK